MKNTNKAKKEVKSLSDRNLGFFERNEYITTVYIGNLRYNEDESSIKKMFQKFGTVNYVRIIFNRETKKSTGVAFIQMPKKSEALKAIESLNGKDIHGRTLKVSIALENDKVKKTQKTYAEIKAKKDKLAKELEELSKKPIVKKQSKKGLNALFNYLKAK